LAQATGRLPSQERSRALVADRRQWRSGEVRGRGCHNRRVMADRRSPIRAAAPVCAALLSAIFAGCSLLGPPWSMHQRHAQPAPPAPPPPPPSAMGSAPVATFKFELDPKDDLIGQLEVTHTTKDDTLVDIARLFDLGYEEISRANPGVDMWVPGAGHKVVLPTEFVLPAVPHSGIVINIAAMRLYYFPP